MSTVIVKNKQKIIAALGVILWASSANSIDQPASPLLARVQQVADSHRLFYRGQAKNDALSVALAAELRAEALGTWQPEGNTPGGLPSPEDMLSLAASISRGDPVLAAVTERVRRRRTRGNTDGPLVKHALLSANEPIEISASFNPGLPAIVYVESSPERSFALEIADGSGSTVCEDAQSTERKLCRFSPEKGSRYLLVLSTTETNSVEILLITN